MMISLNLLKRVDTTKRATHRGWLMMLLIVLFCGIYVNGNGIHMHNGGIHVAANSAGIDIGGHTTIDSKCPRVCNCVGTTMDCSKRGLTQVPRRIPIDMERM